MTNLPRQGSEGADVRGYALLAATLVGWSLLRLVEARTVPLDGTTAFFATTAATGETVSPFLHAAALCAATLVSLALIGRMIARRAPLRTPQWAMVTLACAVTILNLLHVPHLSNDLFLYRALGLVQAKGMNPYLVAPSSVLPAADVLNVPFANQVSAYGPLALFLFRAAAFIGDAAAQVWTLKVLVALPAIIASALVLRRAARERRSVVLAYTLLSPLVVLELFGSGHLEGWISLLLVIAVASLARPGALRIAGAGMAIGLAACVKMPVLACLAPCLALLVRRKEHRRASHAFLLLAVTSGTVALLYAPFWDSSEVLEGLFQQSEMVRRSLHFLLLEVTGLRSLATGLGVSGAVLATVAGFLVCVRGGSVAISMAVTLLLQAVLGRTFFQPWPICPLVFLSAWSLAERNAALPPSPRIGLHDALTRLLIPVLSASAIIGGYVPYILVSSPGSPTEWISIALILGVSAIVMGVACCRHRPMSALK